MFSHYSREDLSLLKRPAVTFLAVLSASVALYGGALIFHNTQQRALHEISAAKERIEFLARNVVEEGETIRNYLDRYRQLVPEGVMGDEERLDLIEAIGRTRERHRLFPVQVEIEPQMSWFRPREQGTGKGPVFRASPIHLSLPLLHEGDLVRLLEGLSGVPGLFIAETCLMERLSSAVAADTPGLVENLNASCRLYWVTLQE